MDMSCHESVLVELTPGLVRLWPDHSTVGPDPHIFSRIALCAVRGVTDGKPIQICVLHYACLLDGFDHPPSLLCFSFYCSGLFFNAFVAFVLFSFTVVEYLCSSYAD